MADENEGDHLDEEGCYAGNIVGQEACPKSSGRALSHPILPYEEICQGVVGEHSTLKGNRRGDKQAYHIGLGKDNLCQKPHHQAVYCRASKGGEHKLDVSCQLFHISANIGIKQKKEGIWSPPLSL